MRPLWVCNLVISTYVNSLGGTDTDSSETTPVYAQAQNLPLQWRGIVSNVVLMYLLLNGFHVHTKKDAGGHPTIL